MLERLLNLQRQEAEEHWVSISDVMTGLMVIFLFIAISYMVDANKRTDDIEKHLGAYSELQANLSKELQAEFEDTDANWKGHLDMATLSIHFKTTYQQNEPAVPDNFKDILRDFFPRYIAILTRPEYKDQIAEIRIEGHTSSEWDNQVTRNEAYIKNMELSQNRARNVLDYVLRQTVDHAVVLNRAWLRKHLTANGLSSSQLILNLNTVGSRPSNTYSIVRKETGIPFGKISKLYQSIRSLPKNKRSDQKDIVTNLVLNFPEFEHNKAVLERAVDLLMENKEESRRVEFRVVTKSEELIEKIRELTEISGK
jgi:outer membrane protein OmpA-like peptidoglycan-associated protein